MQDPGLSISFAGPNNIGKTTQARRLTAYLEETGKTVKQIKFPMYDLLPYGPTINRYFRDQEFRQAERARYGFEQAEKNTVALVIANHRDFEPTLREQLGQGISFVIEDGLLSSVAWTMVAGYTVEQALELHQGLSFGDVTILLNEVQGNRYEEAVERGHVNEESKGRQAQARTNMLLLAEYPIFQCVRIDFQLDWSKETVFDRVLQVLKQRNVIS